MAALIRRAPITTLLLASGLCGLMSLATAWAVTDALAMVWWLPTLPAYLDMLVVTVLFRPTSPSRRSCSGSRFRSGWTRRWG